MKRTERL